MTTVRYAIELEPGFWWNTHGHWTGADASHWRFDQAVLTTAQHKDYWLSVCQKQFPQARVVPVKCEVRDD